jgi:hypothetical protein
VQTLTKQHIKIRPTEGATAEEENGSAGPSDAAAFVSGTGLPGSHKKSNE